MPQFTSSPALQARTFDLQDIQRRSTENQLLQSKLQQAQSGQLTPAEQIAKSRLGIAQSAEARAATKFTREEEEAYVVDAANRVAPLVDPSLSDMEVINRYSGILSKAQTDKLPGVENAPPLGSSAQVIRDWANNLRAQAGEYEMRNERLGTKSPEAIREEKDLIRYREKVKSSLKGKEAKAPEHYRWSGETGELEPIPGGKFDPSTSKNRFNRSTKLRTEYTSASGDWIKIRDAHGRVETAAKDPSAAGDLALIFNYMKVLDPGSVVRESEFATAAASGSWGDRIQAAGLKIIQGQRLSPDQRQDFLDRSRRLATAQHEQQKRLVDEYTGLAERASVDPKNVVVDYMGGFKPYDVGASLAPPVGTIVDGMRFKGGDPREEDSWEEVS